MTSDALSATRPANSGRLRQAIISALSIVAVTLTSLVAVSGTASAAPYELDGLSRETAAASCWEIKQLYPSTADGIYWLYTPAMHAPDQFYCDMTTEGGGWVLIGRGREGWRMEYEGLGSPAQLRETVTGQGAFQARQLPATTVDGLLNGQRVDAMTDGIRLRRATNTAGTTWQEARFNFNNRDRWVWTFSARHVTKNVSFAGVTGGSGMTSNFGADNNFRRVNTEATQAQNWTRGFAFGSGVVGSPAASSHLWSSTTSTGWARPFTQMYLRPRIVSPTFATIADSGTPAIERIALAETRAIPTVWGVSGLATSGGELRTEVQAFTQSGDYMYVGGNFRYVQRNLGGLDQVEQPFLAAFNIHTGQWLSSFRPTLNNQVKALETLPNGQVIVGGEFTQANGAPAAGIVALNPTTGATSASWNVQMENRLTSGVLSVRSLKIKDNWLYMGGQFTHLSGGGSGSVYARGAARVSVANGTPDGGWNPALNGAVNEVEPSADGTRVYAAGYFTLSNGQTTHRAAALQTTAGAAVVPWTPTFSAAADFQFAVTEAGDRVWLGGSEHSFFSYDRESLSLASGNITIAGGDFQTSTATSSGVVYGGCHCDDYNYSNSFTWSNPGTNWTQADKIGFVGAWNEETGDYLPEFNPITKTRGGYGAWASYEDSNGVLWLGGSYESAISITGANQWAGGYVRYAPRDATAPTSPSSLTLVPGANGLELSWSGSTDNSGQVSYEILRDDRVVATSQSTSAVVSATDGPSRWFVRAVDEAGNRSASTPVAVFDPDEVPDFLPVISAGSSSWQWRYDSASLPGTWVEVSFDDSAWEQGQAPLGFGSSLVQTVTHTGPASTRPLSAQYRHVFEVEDLQDWGGAEVTLWVDDGAIAYVNGVEIGRGNLPEGTIGQGTYATAAPRTTAASGAPAVFEVPGSLLVEGTNVLAVQTHLNFRSTIDSSMEATLTLESAN